MKYVVTKKFTNKNVFLCHNWELKLENLAENFITY